MLIIKLETLWALGLINLLRVGLYRTLLRFGLHSVQRLRRVVVGEVFFDPPRAVSTLEAPLRWQTHAHYFGRQTFDLGANPPDWLVDPFSGRLHVRADKPWWQIPDFSIGAGDIKIIWEASRFDWVLAFAQQAASGAPDQLQRLNHWLADWNGKNPAYSGPNWKCGQEASIRVLHLLLAARILGQEDRPRWELVDFVEAHLARIAPTIGYAVGQDNNHATSEAAALFAAGAWLERQGRPSGRRWSQIGRHWLEDRASCLIDKTGTFSQYSVNYHRLLLDTLCLAELWRSWLGKPKFSERFYQRASAATHWLSAIIDPVTGDVPNIGANDGANLLPLTNADYRDYRPSLALASILFKLSCYPSRGEGSCATALSWLGLKPPGGLESESVELGNIFHASGFMVLRRGSWRVVFRYPEYRFRPSHCDQLHVDLWLDSLNWLRDGGTYSYNTDTQTAAYFTGAAGHNTVEFDQREAMPQLGRFLRGGWLRTCELQGPRSQGDGTITAAAAYCDWQGAVHHRQLLMNEDGVTVVDTVSGFKKQAVLRWRLPQGDWRLQGSELSAGEILIRIKADTPIERLSLVDGWESRYYLNREVVKVLEVCVCRPGKITSFIARNQ